jgi:pyruvate dehydrogenase E2 component (dihydrolipoamide acetyltransferase)
MARHIAAEHGLDLAEINGSGPQGRVVRADVEAALSGSRPTPDERSAAARPDGGGAPGADGTPAARPDGAGVPGADGTPAARDGDERVPLSQMRRTIARRLAEAKRTIPHFYLTTVVDATDLGALRHQINDQAADAGVRVSFNDLIVKGAALAIRRVPEVNVSFADDALIRHHHVNVGIAVATERGLIVPVLRDADQKSLGQIAREARDLAERANAGKLQPDEYSGGTFSVSNLGMFGVEQFQAVINPPESAILAVGALTREPAEYRGEIALRDRLRLTLSVDHRALDGAAGARYLQALKTLLEKPMLLLV